MRNFRSKIPAVLFPYSAGNALMKKSELAKILLFRIETGPPELPEIAKCEGFGMSTPSIFQTIPSGEFPRTTMSFRESSAPCTPAKLDAILAGSAREPG